MATLPGLMRVLLTLCLLCGALNLSHAAARHVVVVVWDGMRPDFVTERNTPTLHGLVRRGVFFRNNHSVFLSSTEVNGATLATGAYPQRNGVIGNREFRPDIDPLKAIRTESLEAMRHRDAHGHYLGVPTLAELLQARGHRTAIAGSKPVVLLHDRSDRPETAGSVNVFEGRTLPTNALAGITRVLGAFPESGDTKTNRDLWTTHALIGTLWEKDVPAFSLLWLAEPDSSQHTSGIGSERSMESIRNSDRALALVIDALKRKGVYDKTDIIVVSDHGFSTIDGHINIVARLQEAGFNASREFKGKPAKGDVLVIGLGGSVLIYVAEHDQKTIQRIADFLQTESYIGVLFTDEGLKGTFPLEEASIDSADAPDIAVSLRWTPQVNQHGAAGSVIAEGGGTGTSGSGQSGTSLRGTHVSLSPYDLHNTLIAAGPDFREGFASDTPSGNVDVAPTILHLLGVKQPRSLFGRSMDGRVLFEALKSSDAKPPRIKRRELRASAKHPGGEWTQKLSVVEVNGVRYLVEGNGEFKPAAQSAP